MRDEQVGDIVHYKIVSQPPEQAVILALKSNTEATIRLLTGPERGTVIDSPWGIIESVMHKEDYAGSVVEIRVCVLDNAFSDRGVIRTPNSAGTGLPMLTPVRSTQRHATPEAAMEAGAAFAKKIIDGTRNKTTSS